MAKKTSPPPVVEATNGKSEKKAAAPVIGRQRFLTKAPPLKVTVGSEGPNVIAGVREFSTGSLGWYANEKTVITVDGVPVRVQIGLNITVIGSKQSE